MADLELRGWWISPQSEVVKVSDHFKYILDHPETFGFGPDDLAEVEWEPRGENRDRYMTIALQAGWIRIREQKGFTIIQCWEKNGSVIERLKQHLAEFDLTPQSSLAVSEVSSRSKYNTTAAAFLTAGN